MPAGVSAPVAKLRARRFAQAPKTEPKPPTPGSIEAHAEAHKTELTQLVGGKPAWLIETTRKVLRLEPGAIVDETLFLETAKRIATARISVR
ncbi:MAG: hypothetical protein ACYDCP_07140 [Thermoplasmataceae archaeon]